MTENDYKLVQKVISNCVKDPAYGGPVTQLLVELIIFLHEELKVADKVVREYVDATEAARKDNIYG